MPKTLKPKTALLEFACPYDYDKNLPKLRQQCKKQQITVVLTSQLIMKKMSP
jgi:isochorismate hydrolase